jgi:alpha-L-rhamnosidase
MYEGFMNGERIGNQVLTPGWTSYENRLQYQTYDVTKALIQGNNAVGIALGDGWYRGQVARARRPENTQLMLLFQLEIEYTDGTTDVVKSDKNWRWNSGPLLMSDIYEGETYDARLEMTGWTSSGFDDTGWQTVEVVDIPVDQLVGVNSVPISRIEEVIPRKIFTTPEGDLVVDMGVNMVGWVRLKVKGASGDKVTLFHAEVLDKKGNFYTENLRRADQKIEYTLKGGETEVYEPHFTFQGFRYVKVVGFPGNLQPENITGVVVHSRMAKTGTFECSHPLINQLQKNIEWGQKGNFVDVPTDCPQRDERLGWTGDAQVFSKTAMYNYDVGAFFTKWLADLAADQTPDGAVPHVIPDVLQRTSHGSTGWADAATIIPWAMYNRYGDKRILENQYESMKKWVNYLEKLADEDLIVRGGFHFGDWLFFISPTHWNDKPGYTDIDLIATAFFAYSSNIVAKTAHVLGNTGDEEKYRRQFTKISESFRQEFVTPNNRLSPNSQTAYVLALYFDLLDEANREKAVEYLVNNIRKRGNHLSTGFLGTPYICHVLSQNGYTDVAYDLLMQESYPSWLYPVRMGATTIWERWDGIKPDSTFQTPRMNSFNHYAYGAIGDWMYSTITGIKPGSTGKGYQQFVIAPEPTDNLDYAKTEYQSMFGTIRSSWKKAGDGRFSYSVVIPPNTTAQVVLKTSQPDRLLEGGSPVSSKTPGIRKLSKDAGYVTMELGSGTYDFTE